MSKYYQPTIEEFHIGFEYESFGLHVMNQTWAKMVIDNGTYQGSDDGDSDWYEIGRNLDKVRVKYLDREDIEDEGWIYDKSIDGYYLSKDEDYILKVWNNGCISIDVVPKGMALADGLVPYILIRAIEVKNKSKFKETIKMLAI